MEKLNFACAWGYGDIRQSWSGTNYGLYSHLQKYYEVENVNTGIFRLNAKPCGILDFAHTTHGLNP